MRRKILDSQPQEKWFRTCNEFELKEKVEELSATQKNIALIILHCETFAEIFNFFKKNYHNIAETTLETHLQNIRQKLDANSLIQIREIMQKYEASLKEPWPEEETLP